MITVKELPDLTKVREPAPLLYCHRCGGEYTADKQHYFMSSPDTPLRCCEQPLRLVVKTTAYRDAPEWKDS